MSVLVGDLPISQEDFAWLVGISQPTVSNLCADGIIDRSASGHQWLLIYCHRLREVAAGRKSAKGDDIDLVEERALLARSQREGQEIKNATLRGEYASVSLLSQVLANASQAVVDRLDMLPLKLKKRCPNLTADERDAIMSVIAEARTEWLRGTENLVAPEYTDDADPADQLFDESPIDQGLAHDDPPNSTLKQTRP